MINTKHLPHFVPLVIVFIVGILAFYFFSFDRYFQAVSAVALAASYSVWGILHHKSHNDLYFEVVLEYLLFSLLGLAVVLSLILRA